MKEPNFIVKYNSKNYEVHLDKGFVRHTTFTGHVVHDIICEFNDSLYLVEEDDKFPMIKPFQIAYCNYLIEHTLFGEQDE